MDRSRQELSNEYLLAKFGLDTAENEPCKVCPLSAYRSPRFEQKLIKKREWLEKAHEAMVAERACSRLLANKVARGV